MKNKKNEFIEYIKEEGFEDIEYFDIDTIETVEDFSQFLDDSLDEISLLHEDFTNFNISLLFKGTNPIIYERYLNFVSKLNDLKDSYESLLDDVDKHLEK